MHRCIFTPHCTEQMCDNSCPVLVETSYLLERNGISMNSLVFKSPSASIDKALDILKQVQGKMGVVLTGNTVSTSELITYCAICQNWQGSRLHCSVYNLRYSKFIEDIKKSWSAKSESEELEYTRIWSNSAKVLVISNIDYVNFGDFESQTLLNLLQTREVAGLSTIIISPKLDMLVGKGMFFARLQKILSEAVIK